ncbi:MFS transporter [Geodermatophilus sp. DSM 45219]|uniref:MFS transporter n=1 Tax=Geodermatophilus sp. DSM 45219 TaxID=1881103 RepID=UPI0008891C39|nr:MFS transporter [Geodermatophilus sp. DSM 45219]SDN52622.1 Major Facilitator Superfamily protein [Geodermatophilus sp. DSM 45219]
MPLSDVRQKRARRLGPANSIIVTHGLSSFCLGLVFPYTSLYLADKPAVGTGGVALFYGVTGAANLAVAVLLGTGRVRVPRVPLCVTGNLSWFVGYVLLFAADSRLEVCLAAAAIGAGQGCFLAAIIPILNSLVSAEERRSLFARRFAVLNATLAAGSLVAGTLTVLLRPEVIPYFFLVNAAGMLPVAIVVLVTRQSARPEMSQPQNAPAASGRSAQMPTRTLLLVAAPAAGFQLAAYLFGFSQFEATAPLVTVDLMSMPLYTVSLMLALNVLVIVIAQRPVTRLLEPRSELTGLCVTGALWGIGYLAVGVLAWGPPGMRLGGLLAFAVLFALGECAYSCSFHPWLISLVPDEELTRANALANSMMGIGQFAGPAVGVALAVTGDAPTVWLTLALSCTLLTALLALFGSLRSSGLTAGAAARPQESVMGA